MNQKAGELGVENTHFCNSTGLHDSEHYSTVKDISALLQYALKNETFRAAFTSSQYSTLPSEQHPKGFTFYSTMFECLESRKFTGGKIIGGKTGYTKEAGCWRIRGVRQRFSLQRPACRILPLWRMLISRGSPDRWRTFAWGRKKYIYLMPSHTPSLMKSEWRQYHFFNQNEIILFFAAPVF